MISPLGPDQATLYRLTVSRKYRRRGIATELLREAQKVCHDRGVKKLGIYVNSSEADLIDFYEKRGFAPITKTTYDYLSADLTKETK
jgi:ribosomal protein S18 acetylase RimI-like enzyme